MWCCVGHVNPDFDAYASCVAAARLFPDARAVYAGSQNLNVRSFHHLHGDILGVVDAADVDPALVHGVVMVDTVDPSRLAALGDVVAGGGVDVVVYDHHVGTAPLRFAAVDHSAPVGATTTLLVHEMMESGLVVSPLEASLYLLGIHEDTGSLTYAGTTPLDAAAVSWLMGNDADLEVLARFLSHELTAAQREVFEQLRTTASTILVKGQEITIAYARAEDYVDSSSIIGHHLTDDLGYRVFVGVVETGGRFHVIGRSRVTEIDIGAVMERVGGGGHAQAASAVMRASSYDDVVAQITAAFAGVVAEPTKVRDVMSKPVRTLTPLMSMAQAGEVMARWGHGGLPVIDSGDVVGMITRKDVDKAIAHRLGHAPVKGFMGGDVITASPDDSVASVEDLMAKRNIGRVPVISEGVLVGIVSRKDVLRAAHGAKYAAFPVEPSVQEASRRFRRGVSTLLPPDVGEALRLLGAVAADTGVRAHVVGGFVRDMILGRPNLDVDVVVEGDGIAFAREAAQRLNLRVKVHQRFGTAVLVFSKSLHMDVASSRAEYYISPGALPTVEHSSLRSDLFRRDFTMNAMAARIDEGEFGEVTDPFGGMEDLEAGVLRVLHRLSFIDDPTRVLRAARFQARYGFVLDETSADLARDAVTRGVLEDISGARIRAELFDIIDEESVGEALAHVVSLGAVGACLPRGTDAGHLRDRALTLGSAVREFSARVDLSVDRRAVLVVGLVSPAGPVACGRWVKHLHVGGDLARDTMALARQGTRLVRTLDSARPLADSALARLLDAVSLPSQCVLWSRCTATGRERIERYLLVVARVRAAVSGNDLIAMGAVPDERFSAILARVREHRLDGVAVGREAELADLKKVARRAGVLPTDEDVHVVR